MGLNKILLEPKLISVEGLSQPKLEGFVMHQWHTDSRGDGQFDKMRNDRLYYKKTLNLTEHRTNEGMEILR